MANRFGHCDSMLIIANGVDDSQKWCEQYRHNYQPQIPPTRSPLEGPARGTTMLVGGVARDHSHDDLVTFGEGYVLEGEVVVGLNEGRGEYVFSAVAEHKTEEALSRCVEVASKYPSLVGGGVRGSKYCRVLTHDYLLWPDYYMDYERTKDTESQVVNRTRMAEGRGFESFHDSKRALLSGRLGQALA